MEIDYYDDDFCKDDLDEVTDLDELKVMESNLQNGIWNNEEWNKIYKKNMGIVQSKINEVENDT